MKSLEPIIELTYSELRDRVLSGYSYTIRTGNEETDKTGGRNLKIMTGRGEVLSFLDECERLRMPAYKAGEVIICHTDIGDYPLSKLNVTKK